MKTSNKTKTAVLITGANRGMGLGYVKHYLARNRTVIATCRELSKAETLLELQHQFRGKLICTALDVTDENSFAQLHRGLQRANVGLALIINNAGISQEELFEQWTVKNFNDHFLTNTIGPAMVIQTVVPFLHENSKIIQITSGMGSLQWNINPENGFDAYAASKSALHSLTIRLAEKLRHKNIGVYLINPSWVKTDMGGAAATYSVEEAVAKITTTIQHLTLEQTGSFVSEDGVSIPW